MIVNYKLGEKIISLELNGDTFVGSEEVLLALENEFMLFSPYLVHGGGYNFNENKTKMSLEMRFWKR